MHSPFRRRLSLLEAFHRQHEDDRATDAHLHGFRGVDALRERKRLCGNELRARLALGADDLEDAVQVRGIHAREDGSVAAAEESARAAHLGRGVAALDELADEGVGLVVGGDDDDELLVGDVSQ